jgi:ubiquinone/menaquinone biosynthesis C-methylase UbiE
MTEPAVGVAATYDRVASEYHHQLAHELDHKPLDRALLEAFVELVGVGTLADVGCGPGHITGYLAERRRDVIGVDLSAAMVGIAREQYPEPTFTVGSMLRLPAADDGWAGALALYSIIHLTAAERAVAWAEFARVIRPGGWLLVAFHIDSAEVASGSSHHLTSWFGESVDVDAYFLEPDVVADELAAAGFTIDARLVRRPVPAGEYPSRRCYLIAQLEQE